jgi:hypothetical protein
MLSRAFVVAVAADIARSDDARPSLIREPDPGAADRPPLAPQGKKMSIATAGAILDSRG